MHFFKLEKPNALIFAALRKSEKITTCPQDFDLVKVPARSCLWGAGLPSLLASLRPRL